MAIMQINTPQDRPGAEGKVPCPKCGNPLLEIDGQLTKWLTCTGCGFKKLEEKKENKPQVRDI